MPPMDTMRLTARDLAGARANLDMWQQQADSPFKAQRIAYWCDEVERLRVEMDRQLDGQEV